MQVQLYVYDLSQGLARQMSLQFLGVQIDAVYHTSLVFDGVEYFFGQGVHKARPGSTHHGRPMEIISLGETSLPIEIILEYLESLKDTYTAASYDLFTHNCNNFTNDFAQFLVGRGIPDHITSLPRTVLDTPFGQMLRPQLDRAMRPITQAPNPAPITHTNCSTGITPEIKSKAVVHVVTTETRLNQLLDQAKSSCAIIFFTSQSCGPCRMLYPIYEELAVEFGERATLIKVDVGNAREIGLKYSIHATPTFYTYLKGKQEETWSGADASRLRGNIRLLVQSAFPPHPHQLLKLSRFNRQPTKPIVFSKVPPLEKLRTKMGQAGQHQAVQQSIDFINSRNGENNSRTTPIPDLSTISTFFAECVTTMNTDTLFTIYDLFSLLLLDPRISGYYVEEASLKTINTLLSHVTSLQDCPYNLRLCALHAACNLFTTPLLKTTLAASSKAAKEDKVGVTNLVPIFVPLLVGALLDEAHPAVRVSASALAYNLATAEHAARLAAREKNDTVHTDEAAFVVSEAQQVELAVAVLEALSVPHAKDEAGVEAARLQGLAVARLAYLAPVEGEVAGVCDALGAGALLCKQGESVGGEVGTLLSETGKELFRN